jgi:hypothetical protein
MWYGIFVDLFWSFGKISDGDLWKFSTENICKPATTEIIQFKALSQLLHCFWKAASLIFWLVGFWIPNYNLR